MGPMKKSKSVNKGFVVASNVSPDKSKHKKRKLSDMLGPQWSKRELERFYEAYRKYGHDWKKVASYVRSRSIEMVEALYNMNRAYLSLPEGTASVVGLLAMMTDHYNVLGGSGGERDVEVRTVITRKLQKHPKAKVHIVPPKENSAQAQSIGSSDRCLPLLKRCHDVIPPYIPVRKRTPRVPVSILDIHSNKKPRRSAINMNSDDVLCGALLSTEEPRQTPSSPHVQEAKRGDTKHVKPLQNSARIKGHPEFLVEKPTYSCVSLNEESADGSLGSNEVKNGDLIRDSVDSVISASCEDKRGRKKGKKEEVALAEAKGFNGVQEAYNLADKRHEGKTGFEVKGLRTHRSASEVQRKRSKKLMFEDEQEACDALQALAEMSAMMPYLADNPAENGGESVGKNTLSDVTLRDEGTRVFKKKRESGSSKVQKAGIPINHCIKPTVKETLADEEVKPSASSGHISIVRSCESSMRSPDVSSSNDRPSEQVEVAVSSSQVHPVDQVVNPIRRRTIRKRDRTLPQRDKNSAPRACSNECMSSAQNRLQCLTEKISYCLSWHDLRKWCTYEWFYSAIDYPWFAKREFVEYLDHVGLGHVPRLTRVEWGVIRSSLGKPRRFSERFLQEEREKLKQYRESVRTHYANLRAGHGEGLPTDLARPLSVGQKVVAIHPKRREIHNGSILTVDHHSCLVQFADSNLGVELVMDIDCMPLNPVDNMPEALRRPNMPFDFQNSQGPSVNGAFTAVSEEHKKNLDPNLYFSPFDPSITNEVKATSISHARVIGNGSLRASSATQSQYYDMARKQPRKDDMKPIPGLRQSSNGKALEQHSRSPGNPLGWPHSVVKPGALNGTLHSLNNSTFSCQDTALSVAEIVEESRDKAQRMVDIAIKAMTLIKEGEDAFERIGEALDAPNKADRATHCKVTMATSSNTVRGSPHQDPDSHFASKTQLTGDASETISADVSAESDLQVPSNLIASCVTTLLMIQKCTERQFPPAEVARILDNAVTSMQPCCSQNMSIYREIQMCMGRIKTQILALVPT